VGRCIQIVREELLAWKWPPLIIQPGEEMLQGLQEIAQAQRIGLDIENYGDALESKIRCIGVSSQTCAVSVPVEDAGIDSRITDALRGILLAPVLKVLHNSQHDRLGLEKNGWKVEGPFYDTLFAHAVVAPQLPHDLGFVCAVETPGPRWKSELHSGSEDRGLAVFTRAPWEKLGPYNCKDSFMQDGLQPALERRIERTHRGHELLQTYHELGEVAIRMRRRGAQVDTSKFDTHREKLNVLLEGRREMFKNLLGADSQWTLGKAGQHPSLRGLFFQRLGLPAIRYSEDTGQPSLDNLTLERYCSNPNATISGLSRTVLQFRKAAKLLSTYINGLPMDAQHVVHPIWKCYGTVTGRWSSQKPNAQNIPKIMRDLYIARPGCTLVAGDYSQLELRFIALFSGDEALLQAYEDGLDVHRLNASVCFGLPLGEVSDAQRKLAKIFVYGANYLGDPETLWRQIVVQFPGTSLALIYRAHRAWFKAHPKIHAWQMDMLKHAREEKFVEEPLSGRREYFHDGLIEPNKVVNFPIQGAAGTLVNRAITSLDKQISWTDESILFQVHDELVLEGPDQSRLSKLLKEHMNQSFTYNGNTLRFPIECKAGPDWGQMVKLD